MSDSSARAEAAGLDGIWKILSGKGYALTNEAVIGLAKSFRKDFIEKYFNSETLRHDPGDWPEDRQRARDVIEYEWRDDGSLHLREYETITITDRADIEGKRDHKRVWLLDNPHAEKLVRTFLALVPPRLRQANGTFGVNLFRTFTNVVTKPHHDDEQFVMLYVLDRKGGGAESYLYRPCDVADNGQPTADPLLRRQLNPGEILLFADSRFKHGATPLEALPAETAMRDALVCTVDYETTYLKPRQAAPTAPSVAPVAAIR